MPEATFEIQTVTPLFLAGADQNTAEIRAPSFRGEMRYWLRALIGGLAGTNDEGLIKVNNAEAAVFGTTDIGSALQVRVSQPSGKLSQFTENISKPDNSQQSTGKGYLLWSMKLKKPSRYYFEQGTKFLISLSTRGEDDANLKMGVAALWLLTHLGGIGSRSRRCAGSLTIKPQKGNTYDFPFYIPADANSLKSQIEQGIAVARSLYSTTQPSASYARFDSLSPKTCHVWILQHEQPWKTPEAAMENIGESLQRYRSKIPLNQRKVFGLPLKGTQSKVERLASPLLLRLVELQGQSYVCLAVLFTTHYDVIPTKDYEVIEMWSKEFRGRKAVQL